MFNSLSIIAIFNLILSILFNLSTVPIIMYSGSTKLMHREAIATRSARKAPNVVDAERTAAIADDWKWPARVYGMHIDSSHLLVITVIHAAPIYRPSGAEGGEARRRCSNNRS